jgi:hypothetical protein
MKSRPLESELDRLTGLWMEEKNKNNKLEAKLAIATGALQSSKQWLYLGSLELTAHMGIPEKKRESMISEIVDNYNFMIEKALSKIEKIK